MELGLIGLGRMGANMSRRWRRAGHGVVGYARHPDTAMGILPAVSEAAQLDFGALQRFDRPVNFALGGRTIPDLDGRIAQRLSKS